jgi:hypothetical protein
VKIPIPKLKKPTKDDIRDNWSTLALYIGGFIVFFGMFTFRLSSLTGQKASGIERMSLAHGFSWHTIYHDPLNAPYFITIRLLRYLHGGLLTIRLASVLWSLFAIFLFFLVARRLHGLLIGCVGTLLFATSAWVLHIGRIAAPDVLLLSAALGILLIFLRKKPTGDKTVMTRTTPLWFLVALVIGGFYVPGVVWLIILTACLRPDVIRSSWLKANITHRVFAVLLGIAMLVPFVHAALGSPKSFIVKWLTITPHNLTIGHVVHRLVLIPDFLFWHGPNAPVIWLGRLPIIEIATALFAVIGAYSYLRRFAQTNILLIIPLIAWILFGLGASSLITIIVAFIYIYAAGGIAYTLKLWQKVFPRNPIARGMALTVVLAIVGLIALYNTRQYFVAWGYDNATRAAYQQKL